MLPGEKPLPTSGGAAAPLFPLPDLAFLGVQVRHTPRCTSTMDLVAALAAGGAPEGTSVATDEQTAGRGRAGRVWSAPPATSILVSALLRPGVSPEHLGQLSILVAGCIARLVEATTQRAALIKWPNDVLVDGTKISGVLAHARFPLDELPEVVLGIGLNVNIHPDALWPGATSLLALTGRQSDRNTLLHGLLADLEEMYRQFLAGSVASCWQEATSRLAYRGEEVWVAERGHEITGTLLGLAPSGALRLRLRDGAEREIWSGDLVRGPRPATA